MRRGQAAVGVKCMVLMALAVLAVAGVQPVLATTISSPNFEVSETEFGAGATLESCSGQYCAQATIGNLSAGDGASSPGVAVFAALPEESEPLIEVIIEDGVSNLGVLDVDKTATKETVVRVRSYKSGGYTMHVVGEPPKYGTHTLKASGTPGESTPGIEQFGINVVKNTTPEIGVHPIQVPSGQMSFGEAAPGYNTPNLFKYVSEEVVASSDTESGRTDYTISMIINIAGSTPAGHYATDFSMMVVPVF